MNDAEKMKLEEKLRQAAPLMARLSGPSVLPDRVKLAMEQALEKKFPQSKMLPQKHLGVRLWEFIFNRNPFTFNFPRKYSLQWSVAIAFIVIIGGLTLFFGLPDGAEASTQFVKYAVASTARELRALTDASVLLEPEVRINDQTVHQGSWPIAELALRKHSLRKFLDKEFTWYGSKKTLALSATFVGKFGYDLKASRITLNITTNSNGFEAINFELPPVKLLSMEMKNLQFTKDEDGSWNKISKEDRNNAIYEMEQEAKVQFLKAGVAADSQLEVENTLREVIRKSFIKAGMPQGTNIPVSFMVRPR